MAAAVLAGVALSVWLAVVPCSGLVYLKATRVVVVGRDSLNSKHNLCVLLLDVLSDKIAVITYRAVCACDCAVSCSI